MEEGHGPNARQIWFSGLPADASEDRWSSSPLSKIASITPLLLTESGLSDPVLGACLSMYFGDVPAISRAFVVSDNSNQCLDKSP